MEMGRFPISGEIYRHFTDKLYQIIVIATHTETGEKLVLYQALFGKFEFLAKPLELFMKEVDHVKYSDVQQQYEYELHKKEGLVSDMPLSSKVNDINEEYKDIVVKDQIVESSISEGSVNVILLDFLDAESYQKKLEILSCNRKHLDDRLINDMAVSLDCTVNEGPIEERIQGLMSCLQAMTRFENTRLR